MKYYAVIDTNVVVSALLARQPTSPPVIIIEKIFEGKITPVFCKEIQKGYSEVLKRKNLILIRISSMRFYKI